ncbi:PTS sugar transporter subunit IIB [Virgibacillus necropolis]|uniref:PTS lactose transporter subunit IIB n=1 Tax=Virgibacillus necropolis TaxID=163877 RepID=A0A221M9J3_9BACI|nr:PTS sugar transporter subunit IIB [Virgibacillus necropolis]ASN04307.1 PTS lactose transporter subunit IIB [Virgibacillus necropolis]
MRILAVCGSGLGSSFMIEMNIKDVLKELNVNDIEVNHADLGSSTSDMADLFVIGRDLAESASNLGELIVLDNILDKEELKSKISSNLKEKNIL